MPISYSQPPQQPATSPSLSKVFCSECGTSGEGRFCTECGTRLIGAGGGGTNASTASTSQVQPPPYNPYPGAVAGGLAPTMPDVKVGGTNGGATQPPAGFNVSGSPVTSPGGTSAPAAAVNIASAGFVNQPVANTPYQQQESPTALFGSQGYRLDAFHHIAREIFVALDRSTYPAGTQMMEATKMRRFREFSGKPIPPYYETHVLPLYYQTIGAQCVGSNVLSWDGWNTFLAHKILSSPDEMFAQLGAVLRGLNLQLPWPLVRTDFPAYAYPDAAARELQFQQGIRDLAGAAIAGRQHNAGGSGLGGGSIARKKLISGLITNTLLFN